MRWRAYVPGAGRFETIGVGVSAPGAGALASVSASEKAAKGASAPFVFMRRAVNSTPLSASGR